MFITHCAPEFCKLCHKYHQFRYLFYDSHVILNETCCILAM